MSLVEWAAPVLAFAGGAFGTLVAFRASRADSRQTAAQSNREEWGRRFTAALGDFSSTDPRRRRLGRTILVQLLRSELATADDRNLAMQALESDALGAAGSTRTIETEGLGAVRFEEVDEPHEEG